MHGRITLDTLTDIVLTQRRGIRENLRLWFISALTYLLYIGLLWVQVALGFTARTPAIAMTSAAVAANAVLYVLFRRSRGERDDNVLGAVQLWIGIAFMWFGYSIAGPAAPAMLIIIASHIVYAMFSVEARKVWGLVVLSLVGIGVVMALCHWFDPLRYPAGEQLMGWLYTALVSVLIARLAALLTRLHENLRSQSRKLAAALEQVRQLATRDDLTQVHNRRHFTELMSIEQAQHERSGSPLCVALLDIDLFKAVNDNHGHQAGDEVLRRFAQSVQQALRGSDLLGRWGGEEFIVLFPDTGVDEARLALERVRSQMRETSYSHIAPGLEITFSAGLVQVMPGLPLDATIERADQAMYRAKTLGRDRIVAHDCALDPDTTTALPSSDAMVSRGA